MTADEESRLNSQVEKQHVAERFNQINFYGVSACTFLLLAALLGAVRADTLKRSLAAKTIETQQQRLRRIVESNMIGICFSLANGQIVNANDALLQLLGYDRAGSARRTGESPKPDRHAIAPADRTGHARGPANRQVRPL